MLWYYFILVSIFGSIIGIIYCISDFTKNYKKYKKAFKSKEKKEFKDEIIGAIILFIIMISLCLVSFCNYFNLETKEILKVEDKIAELKNLRSDLIDKQNEVTGLIESYHNGIEELKVEIIELQEKKQIRNYEQAQKVPTIAYDISLIQRRQVYIEKLKILNIKLNAGIDELLFLQRQTSDDLEAYRVLSSEETRKLIAEINQVIKKYLPEAGELAIKIEEKELMPPEQVWQEIMQKK